MAIDVAAFKQFSLRVLLVVVASITLAACISKPIYNVEDRHFSTSAMIPIGTVQEKIKMIGSERGWLFEDVAPGHMIGNVGNPKHSAKVDLFYTQKSFSIKYLSSQNLRARDGTIHHRYNRWIELFERDLVSKLGLAAKG